ncbi:tyrosine recombinase XerC [Dysgonomonas sp. 25]|uniref:tyrosine recombinase XerC n=1 Tax=Dysgonomonas sp. 25 TaxID=2302933 RepID=UPI0013D8197D|nr:tyrosine recombinase XerC [Dysgonomonas sp. 25]NDV69100.1 tyrosine recombinase XerC [Dysgonomonas sp. 25]
MTQLIEKYLRYLRYERNYSPRTEISYSEDLRQFSVFVESELGQSDVAAVDGDIVRRWIVSLMEAGLSARSVNRKLSALKSFIRYLLRIGELKANPLRKVVGPKAKKPIPSFVNDGDMEHLLDEEDAENTFESIRNRLMMELFYDTGMRRAELIGLQDVDVDFSARMLKVTGKRNKQRLIPMSDKLVAQIMEYMQVRDSEVENLSGYLFVRTNGGQLYPMLVHRIVTGVLESVPTLSKTSPHVLRHSFATGMLNNGADINAVKELLGHSSLASTEVYTHTSFEELKKIYKQAHPRAKK